MEIKNNKESFFDVIRNFDGDEGEVKLELKSKTLKIPISKNDRIALETLERLANRPENLTVADVSEICDFIKYYMEFSQILTYQLESDK